jgi:hypothetical protein
MKRISFTVLLLLLALRTVLAAESQQKMVSVVVVSATSCAVNKKEVLCSDLITYLKDTLHVPPEMPIFVSGGPAQANPALVRELVRNLRDRGFPNSGLAGFIKD